MDIRSAATGILHVTSAERPPGGAVLVAAVGLPPKLGPVLEEFLAAGQEGIDPPLGRATGPSVEAGPALVVLDLGRFDSDGAGKAAAGRLAHMAEPRCPPQYMYL